MRGNKGHHIFKKPTKQHGKETVERKTEGKRSRIGKVITVAGKSLLPDVGSLINFAMRHTKQRSLCRMYS